MDFLFRFLTKRAAFLKLCKKACSRSWSGLKAVLDMPLYIHVSVLPECPFYDHKIAQMTSYQKFLVTLKIIFLETLDFLEHADHLI